MSALACSYLVFSFFFSVLPWYQVRILASFFFCTKIFPQDIQDLLVSWSEHLKEASAVFIRAPSYNKSIFFGGRAAPLDKKDLRIRSIPFATRRATFREAQRVHEVLSTIHVYSELSYIPDNNMSFDWCPVARM